MNNLISYKQTNPYKMILLVVLYAIGATSLPYLPQYFKLSQNLEQILYIILKLLTIIYAIYLMVSLGYKKYFKLDLKSFFKTIIIFLPCLLVCVNNFPFVAILTKNTTLNSGMYKWLLYLLICLCIAVFEECVFRGIVYPIFAEKTTDFKAIIFSSLVFSACHLINAFSTNILFVILQLGYSFLIGAMCAVLFNKSKSIYLAILAHFIFDIGGLLYDYNLVNGNIWDISSVVVTAILGVFTLIYTIIVYFKGNS